MISDSGIGGQDGSLLSVISTSGIGGQDGSLLSVISDIGIGGQDGSLHSVISDSGIDGSLLSVISTSGVGTDWRLHPYLLLPPLPSLWPLNWTHPPHHGHSWHQALHSCSDSPQTTIPK